MSIPMGAEMRVLYVTQTYLDYRTRSLTRLQPCPVLSLFPSFSLPDVLCDPTDLIWRKGTPFEAMTGRTVTSSDGLLAEDFWGFPWL